MLKTSCMYKCSEYAVQPTAFILPAGLGMSVFITHTWAGYLFNNATLSTSRTNRVSWTGAKGFQKPFISSTQLSMLHSEKLLLSQIKSLFIYFMYLIVIIWFKKYIINIKMTHFMCLNMMSRIGRYDNILWQWYKVSIFRYM